MPKKATNPEDEEYEEDVVEDEDEEELEEEEEDVEEEVIESEDEEASLDSISDGTEVEEIEEVEEEDETNPSYLLVHKDEEDEVGPIGEDSNIVITDTNVTEDIVDTDVAPPQPSVSRLYHKKGTKLSEGDLMTKPFLNKYEKTRLLATRARQIALGSPPMVPFPREGQPDPMELAVRELNEKVTPLIIRRTLPSGAYEEFRVKDLDDIYLD